MMAMVRKIEGIQYLWTCHQIGVNSAGNADPPPNGSGTADRSGVAWYKIQTGPNVGIVASGRIYDTAATNPRFYYMPSLAVNKSGDMVVGFSRSSVNEYIGACYTGRLNNGSSPNAPIQYYAGKDWYGSTVNFRWGDYSNTSLDPDGLTIWTIQQYAETRFTGTFNLAWGTWIGAVTPF